MSGSVPPNERLGTTLHQESDDQILAALADRYGTLPEGLRQSADLREVIMPVLRADLALLENYQYQAEPPFAVPLTIIGGLEDRSASPEGLRRWSQHAQAPIKLRLIPGGHFYLRPPPTELIEILREDLAECAAQVHKLHPLR